MHPWKNTKRRPCHAKLCQNKLNTQPVSFLFLVFFCFVTAHTYTHTQAHTCNSLAKLLERAHVMCTTRSYLCLATSQHEPFKEVEGGEGWSRLPSYFELDEVTSICRVYGARPLNYKHMRVRLARHCAAQEELKQILQTGEGGDLIFSKASPKPNCPHMHNHSSIHPQTTRWY